MSSSPTDPYPFTFSTVFIEKPWGGRTLERFRGDLPEGRIGETWDVSARPEGVSEITNGPLRGVGLDEAVARSGRAILGGSPATDRFPLMVRHVSSREDLSVQVHPTREYAHGTGQPFGKDEAWYVLDAEPGATVYAGVGDVSRAEFERSVREGTVRDHLLARPVAAGDCLFIPAGMVHGIRAGVTLIEICENSNTTYRLFDYGRDRGLDLDESFANLDLSGVALPRRGVTVALEAATETLLCLQPTMAVARLEVDGDQPQRTLGESFHALTCLDGEGTVDWRGGAVEVGRGQSVLVPAALGDYAISGRLTVLRSWVPEPDRVRESLLDHAA